MHAAALELYAEKGWSGFTLEQVARRAGAGQGALYRRWSSKAALLADAVAAGAPRLADPDTGSSRLDLLALARHFLASYDEPLGAVGLRMVLDARAVPELGEHFAVMLAGDRARTTRLVLERAHARGDLHAPSIGTALHVLTGATLARAVFRVGAPQPAADERFCLELVESLLTP